MTDARRFGVAGLQVTYGRTVALDGITLDLDAGRIVAVAGGDGAGKTSLLRALVGLVRPRSGEVRRPESRAIGYLPAASGAYPDLTVEENLRFAATAYGVKGDDYRRARGELLERTRLGAAAGRLGANLSGGMRQKLGLAMALVHRPRLLVLDEPSTGIDPVSRKELWKLVTETAQDGAAVLITTTYLDEAGRSDYVCVLDEGTVLLQGEPDALVTGMGGAIVETAARPESAYAWRRGSRWRVWSAGGESAAGARPAAPDLQDAVVVAALRRREDDREEGAEAA